MSVNYAVRAPRELAACPTLTGGLREIVRRGVADASEFAQDVRDLDPKQVMGRVFLWMRDNPERLGLMVFALGALVDPDEATLEWVKKIGGLPALLAGLQEPAVPRIPVPRDDEVILRLHAAGARPTDIALRTGVHRATVAQVIARATAKDEEEGVAA